MFNEIKTQWKKIRQQNILINVQGWLYPTALDDKQFFSYTVTIRGMEVILNAE